MVQFTHLSGEHPWSSPASDLADSHLSGEHPWSSPASDLADSHTYQENIPGHLLPLIWQIHYTQMLCL
jgi:hypothetical protein